MGARIAGNAGPSAGSIWSRLEPVGEATIGVVELIVLNTKQNGDVSVQSSD